MSNDLNVTVKALPKDQLPGNTAFELLKLFELADFVAPSDDNLDWLLTMIRGSLLAVGAFSADGKLIGFGRALGDGVSDAYLQDICVHPCFRGQQIGRKIVQTLLDELKKSGTDWIGLIATPGKADFYRKLGFEALQDFTPMKLDLTRN